MAFKKKKAFSSPKVLPISQKTWFDILALVRSKHKWCQRWLDCKRPIQMRILQQNWMMQQVWPSKLVFKCLSVGIWNRRGWDATISHTWKGYSVEHRPALMGQSPVRTTKTSCSRDLLFDLYILSVSFSNDLAVKTFMPSLLFWAMIGCSSKLRSALCDECISLTFMSPPSPQPNPDSHQWIFCGATPARRPFMKIFLQTPFSRTHHLG